MSTFCPLCGSAVDDGETCSCRSQGIQPVALEGLIQKQTNDLDASSNMRMQQSVAESVSKLSVTGSSMQEEEKRLHQSHRLEWILSFSLRENRAVLHQICLLGQIL